MKVRFPTLIFPDLTDQSQALNHYMTSLESMPTLCSQDSEPLSLEWVKNCGPTTTSQALQHILSMVTHSLHHERGELWASQRLQLLL